MKVFNDFAENTKNDFYLIAFGIGAIALTTLSKSLIDRVTSGILRILSALLLGYATLVFAGHIKDFFVLNPGFISHQKHAVYRKNIFAGCGLCVILMFLTLYAVVSIFL